MLVAVYAYEQIYNGMHGICSKNVIEVENMDEAEDYAREESIDIMNSYSEVMDDLAAEAEAMADYDYYDYEDDAFNEAYEDALNANVAYEIYRIKDEVTESLERLNQEFYNDPEDFIKKYCEEEY